MNAIRTTIVILSALIFVLLSSATPVLAQKNHSLSAGKWALLFEVDDFLKLSSFQGGLISVKKHTSDRAAWRLGIGLRAQLGNETRTDLIADSVYRDINDDSYSLDISIERIFYGTVSDGTCVFAGIGPTGGFGGRKQEHPSQLWKVESFNYSAGLRMTVGFEWFPKRNISLTAEYDLRVAYNHSRSVSRTYYDVTGELLSERESKRSFFSASYNDVLVGLSVYFGG